MDTRLKILLLSLHSYFSMLNKNLEFQTLVGCSHTNMYQKQSWATFHSWIIGVEPWRSSVEEGPHVDSVLGVIWEETSCAREVPMSNLVAIDGWGNRVCKTSLPLMGGMANVVAISWSWSSFVGGGHPGVEIAIDLCGREGEVGIANDDTLCH